MGRTIKLTEEEIKALIDTCSEWIEMMSEGEDSFEFVDKRLDEGLGTALRKLYKGRNGEKIYKHYKFKRNQAKQSFS